MPRGHKPSQKVVRAQTFAVISKRQINRMRASEAAGKGTVVATTPEELAAMQPKERALHEGRIRKAIQDIRDQQELEKL